MHRKLRDDCFKTSEPLLSHDTAIALLKSRINTTQSFEDVPLQDAAGRILAGSVTVPMPVPQHTNAAVDGYAFAHGDYDPELGSELNLAGRAAAGIAIDLPPAVPGSTTRIFTGAAMPPGLDTVVMQEDTETTGPSEAQRIRIPAGLKSGANVRQAGEDVADGATVFETGHIVRPQDLAALSSFGCAQVSCAERLSVAILSTGDEVVRPGVAPLKHGQVYDANSFMLNALCDKLPVTTTDMGILPDDEAAVHRTLATAAERYDVILTTGGASAGEEDHIAAAIDELGQRHFWRIAVKPGRPMMFGQIGDSIFVGLPGNPVAVFVCFLMYVFPMLRKLGGAPWPEPRRFNLPTNFEVLKRKTGRREFWRGMLVVENGRNVAAKFPRDGSGLISGLRESNGLIDIPEDVEAIRKGDAVAFIPYSEFGIL